MSDTIVLTPPVLGVAATAPPAPATTVIAAPAALDGGPAVSHSALHRVRSRLAEHGLSLALQAEPDGWTWNIAERPIGTRRAFASIREALEHADAFTRVWFSQTI